MGAKSIELRIDELERRVDALEKNGAKPKSGKKHEPEPPAQDPPPAA